MLKKIPASEIKIGMFVHDFNCNWVGHPFARNRLMVSSDEDIQKVLASGIHDVIIDTDKGRDADHAPTVEQARQIMERELVEVATRPLETRKQVNVAEELERAALVRGHATRAVRTVMRDVRLGKAIEINQIQAVVQDIVESVLRNPGALTSLLRIKGKDDYTFLHSVSMCTLMVAFCHTVGMTPEEIRQAGIGGLLHDTGKALVPDAILNKPGKLTEAEFAVIKGHPRAGFEILSSMGNIGQIPLDITLHHHERMDGSGYPHRLPADKISNMAKMAAVVDVYDAITSDRAYGKGMPAAEALRKLYEWSSSQFEPATVQSFVRCIGIYPVGSLVLLQSGRLAVVTEAHESNLLTPKVNVFYNTKSGVYIKAAEVDLSRPVGSGGADRIERHETPEKWRVNPARFMIAA
jgi:HD-GYP domain-containing protein (c-di-GMP phosphodiesterase class II)